MDLKEYFDTKSRALGVKLRTYSPTIKKLATGKGKRKEVSGVLASFDFSSFKTEISFTEKGNTAYAQQTIWVNFVLASDSTLPFSLYDILAVTEPDNFNCYTYTYVDSQELMDKCLNELEELLLRIIPKLKEYLESGINKNKLISSQREAINKYFGDNVLENSEALGARADTLLNMMLHNFYKAQIESAVLGSQALFYMGKTEKSLKALRKAKFRTVYQENLLKYLENGGKAIEQSEAYKRASSDNGSKRHGGGIKGGLQLLGYTFLYLIPVAVAMCMLYTLMTVVYFGNAPFVFGITENYIIIPFLGIILSLALALNRTWEKEKSPAKGKSDVHTPESKTTDTFVKYFIIAGETLALIGIVSCMFTCTAFHEDKVTYSEAAFPFSQDACEYKSIDYIAIIDGYEGYNSFVDEKYLVIKTKSDMVIDLYNSTYFSAERINEQKVFLNEKGIELKSFRVIEDVK